MSDPRRSILLAATALLPCILMASAAAAAPKVVVISLDGAKPALIQEYLAKGILKRKGGLGSLSRNGAVAAQNVTATPSLTAVSHIAIATGSTAAHNDIPANTYHPVAATISTSISGFAGPIGGYAISPLGPTGQPTAEPLWVRLRNEGKRVVAATWPGADGAEIKINNTLVQAAHPTRVTDYTVPFGAFGGLSATGFSLDDGDLGPDETVADQLEAAGHPSYSPVLTTTAPFETFTCSSATTATCAANGLDLTFQMRAAVLDSTDDSTTNYDTVVFFEATQGIQPGPFILPATGPAYVKGGRKSRKFFFEGTGNKVGTGFVVSFLAPDASSLRFIRYSANYIPRNAPVVSSVDDINGNVGFWAPQPDFRIPERLSPGLSSFADLELEAAYEDQVKSFVEYQTKVGLRAIEENPSADLVMIYIEEPDGSSHQFTLTDPRQATDPTDPNSIGSGQDKLKVARYAEYLENAYRQADRAVTEIMQAVGPTTDVFVVSDHGMAPFHTAVHMVNVLKNAGIDTSQLAIRTSGPAVNIYVNLVGRESGGVVDAAAYRDLVEQIRGALKRAEDSNGLFNYSLKNRKVFSSVISRPLDCPEGTGFCTSADIGQDSGDVFAQLAEGYNFDGIQNPVVVRRDDPAFDANTTMFSTPNFYGAHGHPSHLPSMSATFIAGGPGISAGRVKKVRNIDVAPTVMHLLGVEPGELVDGKVLGKVLR